MLNRSAMLLLALGVTIAPVRAQQRGQRPNQAPPTVIQSAPPSAQAGQPASHEEHAGPNEEKVSQTQHTVTLNGRQIHYTATAGTLPIRADDGSVAARMFFVAYTKDGEDAKTRPVSFLYNGGPGAATIWLHMGSFAPRRVQMADDGYQPAPPFHFVDNESSLIDATDMVFIDAISTGYSRTVPGVSSAQFHGEQGDLRAFGDCIDEYLSTYNRWPSPKFLIGESYGTIRSAGLSQELQGRHGIELNGIVLISSLLTYQTISTAPQNDIAYVSYFPTFTATAWFHKKLPADLQAKDLKTVVAESSAFAVGEYAVGLIKGNSMGAADRQALAQKIARFTGLSPQYVMETNLRVDPGRFRKELLRDQRLSVGRLDSRFTSVDVDAAGEQEEFDPSNTALQGAYTALFKDYVKNDLKWDSDLQYFSSGNVRPWTYSQNRYMDMTEPLRQSMAKNPFLKVFVCAGYYDMATPLLGSEINLWHLGYDKTFTDRFSFGYYEAGHMIYIRPSAHQKLAADITKFITSNANAQSHTGTQQ